MQWKHLQHRVDLQKHKISCPHDNCNWAGDRQARLEAHIKAAHSSKKRRREDDEEEPSDRDPEDPPPPPSTSGEAPTAQGDQGQNTQEEEGQNMSGGGLESAQGAERDEGEPANTASSSSTVVTVQPPSQTLSNLATASSRPLGLVEASITQVSSLTSSF